MKVTDIKPVGEAKDIKVKIYSMGKTDRAINSTNIYPTYNESGLTYNEAGYTYGGLYGLDGPVPR